MVNFVLVGLFWFVFLIVILVIDLMKLLLLIVLDFILGNKFEIIFMVLVVMNVLIINVRGMDRKVGKV